MTDFCYDIDTPQTSIHPKLDVIIERHMHQPFLAPIATHNHQAFLQLKNIIGRTPNKPIILDSGCGRAMSTQHLAKTYSDCWVIGADKSFDRLSHQHTLNPHGVFTDDNMILIRIDLIALFQLIKQHQWQIHKHYLLYPNPWPKPKQLQRRFHAHPIFPTLLAISKHIELRSNWKIYLEEFRAGCLKCNRAAREVRAFSPKKAITAFEKKYLDHQQSIYQLLID
jgi:tRNA (guanine-N7-)-methyltransferase